MIHHLRIEEQKGLDPIDVFFKNIKQGRGSMTVACFGRAWTYYWGAMGLQTVEEFVEKASDCYVRDCLLRGMNGVITNDARMMAEERWLDKIVAAIVAELKKEE